MLHIFIINPYAGNGNFASELREKLEQIKGFEYFVFATKNEGAEAQLVKDICSIFDNEKMRIYCCGGTGTMRNIINSFPDINNAEFAFFPCGNGNDFANVFGNDKSRLNDIQELINGDVIDVDYLKSNNGIMLNAFSFGIDTMTWNLMGNFNLIRLVAPWLPYKISVWISINLSKREHYIIETEDGIYDGKVTEFFFGNGNTVGGDMHMFNATSVVDGMADYRIIHQKSNMNNALIVNAIRKKNMDELDNHSEKGKSRFVKVTKSDGSDIAVCQDGELITGVNSWMVEVVNKGLHLVVPKGVTLR